VRRVLYGLRDVDVSIFKRTHLDKKGKIVKGQNCV